jgi:copper chaperone NosL
MRRLPALLVLGALACGGASRELVPGMDACEYCRMTISDARFGGQVVSATARARTFDAVECLASFVLDATDPREAAQVRVSDFATARLVAVDSAVFLEGSSVTSPMGRSLVAFAATDDVGALVARYGGRSRSWSEVLDLMRADALTPGADRPGTGSQAPHRHEGDR